MAVAGAAGAGLGYRGGPGFEMCRCRVCGCGKRVCGVCGLVCGGPKGARIPKLPRVWSEIEIQLYDAPASIKTRP